MTTKRIKVLQILGILLAAIVVILLVGARVTGIGLPDVVVRICGATILLAIPVVSYVTVKRARK